MSNEEPVAYTVDQYSVYTVKYTDNTEEHFPLDPANSLYQEMLINANENGFVVEFVERALSLRTLDEVKSEAILRLRDLVQEFLDCYTTKYTREEIAYFATKAELAKDYLANGPSAYNEDIVIEAEVIRRIEPEFTNEQLCQLIVMLSERKKRVLPWSSGIRQVYQTMINYAPTAEQVELILLQAKQELDMEASKPLTI